MREDLIKRSDAIKALCDAVDNKGNYEGEWLYTDELCRAIGSVPSADIPQGEWIDAEIRHEDGVLPIQVCSECKTFYPLEYTGGGHRFCPNCGARMKGADDD